MTVFRFVCNSARTILQEKKRCHLLYFHFALLLSGFSLYKYIFVSSRAITKVVVVQYKSSIFANRLDLKREHFTIRARPNLNRNLFIMLKQGIIPGANCHSEAVLSANAMMLQGILK